MGGTLFMDLALVALLAMVGVALWTLRTIYVSRGDRARATWFGSVEAMLFVAVISHVITPLNPARLIGYGIGVAAGTYAGSRLGNLIGGTGAIEVRTILQEGFEGVARDLMERGWPVTATQAFGVSGEVTVLVTVLERMHEARYLDDVTELAPHAFWTVEEIKGFGASELPDHYRQVGTRRPSRTGP